MTTCPGCRVVLPEAAGPVHRYIRTSPECWAAYGRVLARQAADPRLLAAVHRLTVDTYAAQHPVDQPAQSLAVHLYGLFAALELGLEPERIQRGAARLVSSGAAYPEPRPLGHPGELTVADIPLDGPGSQHIAAVRRWAVSVWGAWSPHHDEVRDLQHDIDRRPGRRLLRRRRGPGRG